MEPGLHIQHRYNSFSNNPHHHQQQPVNTDQSTLQICITVLIIILNGLILIPIFVNRRRFWRSYLYCLLSAIISTILFAVIGMPVSILFQQQQTIILDAVVSCKSWHVISRLCWDASMFSIIYMNLDLTISLVKPNIYVGESYNLFMKVLLVASWAGSLALNIGLVCSSSLKIDPHTPVQPCLHVARLEHLQVSFMWGMIFLLVIFALSYVLAGSENAWGSPHQVRNKLTCYTLSLLLLDAFIVFLRILPEVFHLILASKPGDFLSISDEKTTFGELNFAAWMTLLILPIFWMFDPTIRGTIAMAFSRRMRRSREHEEIQSSSPEE